MSESQSVSATIARRYAVALFALICEEATHKKKILSDLEKDIALLEDIEKTSADFRLLLTSKVIKGAEKQHAIAALAKKIGLGQLLTHTLMLMASRQRLFVLAYFLKALRALIQEHKGEINAEIVSAKALSKGQTSTLAKSLEKIAKKTVIPEQKIDPDLIGGLVIRLGTRMIDNSLRTKLLKLKKTMKEA